MQTTLTLLIPQPRTLSTQAQAPLNALRNLEIVQMCSLSVLRVQFLSVLSVRGWSYSPRTLEMSWRVMSDG
jgi:hypothetical protein